jgi:hypothetical protein
MDGRGRWMDNVFIERLWRSLKYEDVDLKGYADGREAARGIAEWVASHVPPHARVFREDATAGDFPCFFITRLDARRMDSPVRNPNRWPFQVVPVIQPRDCALAPARSGQALIAGSNPIASPSPFRRAPSRGRPRPDRRSHETRLALTIAPAPCITDVPFRRRRRRHIGYNQSLFRTRHWEIAARSRSRSLTMSYKTFFALALVGPLSFLAQPGTAQEKPSLHRSWPIQNGFNLQPTQNELRALHQEDVSPDVAREIDRLYDELLSSSYSSTHHTGIARMR